jgi:hypothetical protein
MWQRKKARAKAEEITGVKIEIPPGAGCDFILLKKDEFFIFAEGRV